VDARGNNPEVQAKLTPPVERLAYPIKVEAVQVSGKAKLVDADDLLTILENLTDKHERQFEMPWKMDKVSEPKLNMKMIVGFEIDLISIKGKSKLSQNRSLEDRKGIISRLRTQNESMANMIADKMELNIE